jgi:hypothetical protein
MVKVACCAGDNHTVVTQLDEGTGRVIGRLTIALVGALVGVLMFLVGVGAALYVEMADDYVPHIQDCSLLAQQNQADCWASNAAAESEKARFWNPAFPWFVAGSAMTLLSAVFGVWSSYVYSFNRRRDQGLGDIH